MESVNGGEKARNSRAFGLLADPRIRSYRRHSGNGSETKRGSARGLSL